MDDRTDEVTPERLAAAMGRFAVFLETHAEHRWAAWVAQDAERVRAGDLYGAQHFLSAFGGMGSINDLIFPGTGGEERRLLRVESDELAEEAYVLAKAAVRDEDAG